MQDYVFFETWSFYHFVMPLFFPDNFILTSTPSEMNITTLVFFLLISVSKKWYLGKLKYVLDTYFLQLI